MDLNVQPEVSVTMPVVPEAIRKLVLMLDERDGQRIKHSMDAISTALLDSELVTNLAGKFPGPSSTRQTSGVSSTSCPGHSCGAFS